MKAICQASLAVLAFLAAAPLRADDWPSFGGDAAGRRYAPEGGVNEFLAPEWQFTLPTGNAGIVSSPIAADGYVYVGARDGRVRCFRVDAETPKLPVWEFRTLDLVEAAPAVWQGRCYVASRDGRVYCLDAETGNLLWRTAVGGGNVSSPVVVGGSVLVGTGFPANSFVSLNALSGQFQGLFSADGQPLFSSPAVAGGVAYVGSNSGRLFAVDVAAGAPVAAFNAGGSVATTGSVLLASPLVNAGAVHLVPGGFDNHVYGWGVADGVQRFATDLDLVLLKGRVEAFKPAVPKDIVVWDRQAQLTGRLKVIKGEAPTERFKSGVGATLGAPKPSYGEGGSGRDPRKSGPEGPSHAKPQAGGAGARYSSGPYSVNTYASSLALQPGLLGAGQDVLYVAWGAPSGSPEMSLVAIRADTGAGLWRHPLGDAGGAPFLPSPVAAGGLVFAAKPTLRELVALGAADESVRGTWVLDGDVVASPCYANGRLFVATMAGSLYSFAADPASPTPANRPPAPPSGGFAPSGFANVVMPSPDLAWAPSADPDGDPVSYLVRADSDGEVLRDWKFEAFVDNSGGGAPVTAATMTAAFPGNSRVTWRVRARDSKAPGATSGAWSPWSAPQVFFVNRSSDRPLPPDNFVALPRDQRVDLAWTPSPSNDVQTYRVWVAPAGQPFGAPLDVGSVTAHSVGAALDGIPLSNGTAYDFKLAPVDFDNQEGDAVVATATPVPAVRLNGVAQAGLDAAVAAALPGDVIRLGAEPFTLAQVLQIPEGVSLIGHAPGFTVIDGNGQATLIRLVNAVPKPGFARAAGGRRAPGGGAQAVVSNLTLRNGGTGIDTAGADGDIRNVAFVRLLRGIDVQGASQLVAINNTFTQIATGALVVNGGQGAAFIRNNLFIRNAGFAVLNLGGSVVGGYNDLWFNNNTVDTTDDALGYSGGSTDLAIDVTFLDEAKEDFREASGTRVIDAGDPADDYSQEPDPNGQRVNIGAFGNTAYAAKSEPMAATPPTGPAPTPAPVPGTAPGTAPGPTISPGTAPPPVAGPVSLPPGASPASAAGGGGSGGGGPCAITTAAYATTSAAQLTRFYRLRDETLRTNLLGSDLVRLYYRVSPPVAATVGESETLKMAVRRILR